MKTSVETVTVAKAKEWLAKADQSDANVRHRNKRYVAQLARAISEGRWELNGSSICLNGRNRVVDGQHRLAAVILANKSIKSVVVRNVTDVMHVDQGVRRQAAAVLKKRHDDVTNPAVAAALARLLIVEKRTGSVVARKQAAVDVGAIIQEVKGDLDLYLEASNQAMRIKHLCRPANAAYLFYKAVKETQARAEIVEFFDALTNATAPENSVLSKLLNRLMKEKMRNPRSRRGRMSRLDELVLLIKAWNYYITDENPGRLIISKQNTVWTEKTFPTVYRADELELEDAA